MKTYTLAKVDGGSLEDFADVGWARDVAEIIEASVVFFSEDRLAHQV